MDRRTVLVPSPYAYQKASWLVPAYIHHYLNVVRPALLSGLAADKLWISGRGTPCTQKALQSQVFTRTQARFGVGFGPHRFRHAIVTTAALRAPQHKHLGAAALGITPAVAEKNYNLAGQVEATRTFAQAMERRHRKLMQSPQKGPTRGRFGIRVKSGHKPEQHRIGGCPRRLTILDG
jgi:hypothetical protein